MTNDTSVGEKYRVAFTIGNMRNPVYTTQWFYSLRLAKKFVAHAEKYGAPGISVRYILDQYGQIV